MGLQRVIGKIRVTKLKSLQNTFVILLQKSNILLNNSRVRQTQGRTLSKTDQISKPDQNFGLILHQGILQRFFVFILENLVGRLLFFIPFRLDLQGCKNQEM